MRVWGGDFRLRVLTGDTLADIRRQYMALTGTPPIPPKSAFGLWISEYGYENWAELDDKIASLKANGFPLSGVVLDLFWFGGIRGNSPDSRMGSLRWDETRFPDPAGKIAALKADGIDMMLIEESYISENLPEYAALAERGGLAQERRGSAAARQPRRQLVGQGRHGRLDQRRHPRLLARLPPPAADRHGRRRPLDRSRRARDGPPRTSSTATG